jgi:nucleoside-diphosphate-sugar epimerase
MNNVSNNHVVFGTGPLGKSVMRALVAQGKRVRMINRSGRVDGLPAGVEVCQGDAYSAEDVYRLSAGEEVVYQCAQPGYTEWVTKFPPMQAAILEGTARAGAKLILGENLYMYGEVSGPIREDLPYVATTRKGKVRAEMAQAALEAHRAGKVRVAMVRGSDFFGPEVLDSSMGERAFLPALQGKSASLVGRLDLPHTYTYIEDFGRAMAILGEREEALGQVWHVPNPRTLMQREFMEIFFRSIGKPPKMSGMGRLMMSIGGIFIPEARESIEMMYEFEQPLVVDSSKFERAFGMKATPLEEAIQKTAVWYQEYLKNHSS